MHRFLQLKRQHRQEYSHCHRVHAIIGIALGVELSAPNKNIGGLFRAVNKSCQKVTSYTSSPSLHAVQVLKWRRPKRTTFNGLIDCLPIYEGRLGEEICTGVMFKSLNVKNGHILIAIYSLRTNQWI